MNAVRFPALPKRGLGVGMDLRWDAETGFGHRPCQGDRLAPRVRAFLQAQAATFSHAFFSFQPRDRALPRVADYAPAWDDLVRALPGELPLALHHTALNLGALGPYARTELLAFTAQLCERYRLRWVNEDVGLWSLAGRPLPYPLPPVLDTGGLRASCENVRECQDGLPVPLVLEFPGFSAGVSVVVGEMHAYDFFRELAERTCAPVTLDVGHLLSFQWLRGKRGAALLDELERLPLAHCFELHLSGCELVGERFVDTHHGVLIELQLELLARLLERCENLRAVTYEDPRLTADGALVPATRASFERLVREVAPWSMPATRAA